MWDFDGHIKCDSQNVEGSSAAGDRVEKVTLKTQDANLNNLSQHRHDSIATSSMDSY